ncbi:hypothetical protein [Gordonia sp. NPDC003950]
MQDEFTEGPHEEVGDESGERIAEQQCRADGMQTRGRTQEQAGSDRTSDGDHLDVTSAQLLFVADLFGGQMGMWGRCFGHQFLVGLIFLAARRLRHTASGGYGMRRTGVAGNADFGRAWTLSVKRS